MSDTDLADKANAGKIFDAVKAWQTAKEIDADGTIGWGTLERADQELETKGVNLDVIRSEEDVAEAEEAFDEQMRVEDEARAKEAQAKAELYARIDEAVVPEKEAFDKAVFIKKCAEAEYELAQLEQKGLL